MEQLKSKKFIGISGQPGRILANDKEINLYLNEVNHSPSGFMWGYGGSGPAQTSYCILREFFMDLSDGDEEYAVKFAKKYYQQFKTDIISRIPMAEDFVLDSDTILDWLEQTIEKEKFNG